MLIRARVLFAALLCLLMLHVNHAAAGDTEVEESTLAPEETNAQVSVAELRSGSLELTLRALGKIAATQQTPASISARVGGVVTEISVRDGEQVSAGAVLIQFDARAADANLTKAQSDLAVAEQELKYAQDSGLNEQQNELDLAEHVAKVKAEQDTKEAERLATLLEKQLISDRAATEARQLAESSRREADTAKRKADNFRSAGRALELERARGRVEEVRAALSQAKIEADGMTVRAPVNAHITRVDVTPGQTVDVGARLVELEASQGIGARFAVSPAAARQIRPSAGFTLHDPSGAHDWHGTVLAVSAGVDAESGLVRVEGLLDDHADAAPFFGQVLSGEIAIRQSETGLIAPESALSVVDGESFVYILDPEQIAHRVTVDVLASAGGEVVLRGPGLEVGAMVITDGNYNLPDGAHVRLVR